MEKFKKNAVKGIVVFVVGILLGFALLVISNLLPTGRIATHVRESGYTIEGEGEQWMLSPNDITSHLDNFTDAIILLTSGYTGEQDAVQKTIYNYRFYQKDASKGVSCINCGIIPEEQRQLRTYEWYWQGHQIVFKPLLMFFNLNEIRSLNTVVVLLFVILICILLYSKNQAAYIFPYVISVAFLNPATIFVSLQYSTIFYLTSISLICILLFIEQQQFRDNIWMLFLIIGMCTSYFDFLTYPVLTMAFTLLLLFVLEKPTKIFHAISRIVIYSILWCVGYGGMWISKWIISSAITRENQISKGVESFQTRTGHVIGDTTITWIDMMTTMKNYLNNGGIKYLVVIFILILIVLCVITKGYKQRKSWVLSIIILMISLYPFIWYTFSLNHSVQHAFFTYKSMAPFIFAISSFIIPLVDFKYFEDKKWYKKNR